MAIGLGECSDSTCRRIFQYPYMATSMTDFWRRWHMTLGSWFKDYVYIPLGGSRCSKGKMIRNLLVVWLFTGLWHGAGWNFLLWGFLLFVLVTVEKLCLLKVFRRVPILGHVYMILAIPLSWLIFAISDPGQIWIYVQRLFPFLAAAGRFSWFAGDYLKYGKNVSDHTAGRNDSDHTTSAKALRAVQRQHVVGTDTDPDLLVQCVLHLDRTG